MELEQYNLQPQEQLAVSLYLKSMNKSQAATDAGFASSAVFNKPSVKSAVAEQLSKRAERMRVGGDWVLVELRRVYERCMQVEKILDRDGHPTGEIKFDPSNALKALALIGKHADVKAFESANTSHNDEIAARLRRARQRTQERSINNHHEEEGSGVSFL
ncbi:terminase small subunit [Spongiibacter marinus]|uniref:terminase small subunit n=1 Tax=Spongiibacter marinus TaxID=354246 RepID=UPI0003F5EEBD|nr:terminase small subunit [Spongiibacter marinus]